MRGNILDYFCDCILQISPYKPKAHEGLWDYHLLNARKILNLYNILWVNTHPALSRQDVDQIQHEGTTSAFQWTIIIISVLEEECIVVPITKNSEVVRYSCMHKLDLKHFINLQIMALLLYKFSTTTILSFVKENTLVLVAQYMEKNS